MIDDEAFFQLVVGRLVEPTSMTDTRLGAAGADATPMPRRISRRRLLRGDETLAGEQCTGLFNKLLGAGLKEGARRHLNPQGAVAGPAGVHRPGWAATQDPRLPR